MTLLEILFVLAVISILATLVIFVMGRLQENLRNTACISNLRQIGIAMNTYASEHEGLYPRAYPDGGLTWMWKLAPYVGIPEGTMGPAPKPRATGVFVCPEWKKPGHGSSSRNASYAISRYIDSYTNPVGGRSWDYRRHKVSSRTILVAETDVNNEYAYAEKIDRRHPKESANYLFVDGHVENIGEEIKANDPRWYETPQ